MRKLRLLNVLAALAGLTMAAGSAAAAPRVATQYSNHEVFLGTSETVSVGHGSVSHITDDTGNSAAAYVRAGAAGGTATYTVCRFAWGGTTATCTTGSTTVLQSNAYGTPSASTDTIAASTNSEYDFYYQKIDVSAGKMTVFGHMIQGVVVP